jgi:hypothetical protein
MNITSASQQFAVAEEKSVAYRRKQQLISTAEIAPRSNIIAVKPPTNGTQPVPAVTTTAATAPTHDVDNPSDEDQVFNAFQTVGMVKRILAQLSSHTADWLDKPLVAEFNSSNSANLQFSAAFSQQSVWLNTAEQRSTADTLISEQWEFGYQAVQASFSGQLTLDSGESIQFALDFSMEVSWARYSYSEQRLQDPLLLSLAGTPVQLTDSSTEFDLLGNGHMVKLPQLGAQQYYLAYDRDQNKQINNGTELFGPTTGNGFAELAEFDDNGNGFIDPSDDIWQYLYLWQPEQNLLSMQQAQLGAISIESVVTRMPLYNSQHQLTAQLQRSGLAFQQDGTPALVQQIDLVV